MRLLNLPNYTKPESQWTDAELSAMIAFRENEMHTEWCGTLVMQELNRLLSMQRNRRPHQPPDIGPDVPGGGAV